MNRALHLFFLCANMHSCKPTITPWPGFKFNFIHLPWFLQIPGPFFLLHAFPFFSFFFFFFLIKGLFRNSLGFECPCRRNISLKHKPLTLVDSIRTCLRHGMHSESWLTRRGPTCAHLFVIHPLASDWRGFALHNYQLSPIFFSFFFFFLFFFLQQRREAEEVET